MHEKKRQALIETVQEMARRVMREALAQAERTAVDEAKRALIVHPRCKAEAIQVARKAAYQVLLCASGRATQELHEALSKVQVELFRALDRCARESLTTCPPTHSNDDLEREVDWVMVTSIAEHRYSSFVLESELLKAVQLVCQELGTELLERAVLVAKDAVELYAEGQEANSALT